MGRTLATKVGVVPESVFVVQLDCKCRQSFVSNYLVLNKSTVLRVFTTYLNNIYEHKFMTEMYLNYRARSCIFRQCGIHCLVLVEIAAVGLPSICSFCTILNISVLLVTHTIASADPNVFIIYMKAHICSILV
jgi:hypothetical protein